MMDRPLDTPPPHSGWGPVIITPREVYDAVIRLESQVKTLVQAMTQHTGEHERRDEEIDARLADHEQRLRARERAAWPLPSVAALTAVAAVIVAVIALQH